jgi:hypothetical protein
MTTFAERLRSTFATLARPLTAEDGDPESSISGAEIRLGLRLSAVLREYYLLAGRFDRFNLAHHRLLRPEKWFLDDGKLVFLEENQWVLFWSVEASLSADDDPPIYQGPNIRGQPIEWYLEHGVCSEFLLVTLHLQAVWGGYEFIGGSDITPDAVARFLTGWTPAGRVNELLAFNRDGGAACVVEGEGKAQLYVGGRTEREFEAIVAELEAVGVGIDQL